ncbi:MAG: lipoprotein signal peptidase [Dysgonamonadaceae bacterium]|jgi:signal peptidase II|nr:lipoprotein signal peptidase [Dysgonamonadaceae bacterium]
MKPSKGFRVIGVILLVLLVDQVTKIWVKTHLELHDSIRITDWFQIYFTENPGMAFGWEFFDKVFLTLFRLAASVGIAYYLWTLLKRACRTGYVITIALILAGAVGNIIDCLFYGLIFDHSYGQLAVLFPESGGYAPFLQGKVVDMLYFPLIETTWPAWMPVVGGNTFIFFRPIFNIADSAISVGFILLLLFYRKELSYSLEKKHTDKSSE